MTSPLNPALRTRIVALLLLLGAASAAGQWALWIRPRAARLEVRRRALDTERTRLAATRAELLRLGSEGIAARTRALRAEVVRREALAPPDDPGAAGMAVRERFATLAARYGVHAPSFEPVAVRREGELQVGGVKIRASGDYHAIGTWLAEALSDTRLLSIQRARLDAVPDSLTSGLGSTGAPPAAAPPPGQGSPALQLAGAAPLEAVVEVVVEWYARPAPAGTLGSSANRESR